MIEPMLLRLAACLASASVLAALVMMVDGPREQARMKQLASAETQQTVAGSLSRP